MINDYVISFYLNIVLVVEGNSNWSPLINVSVKLFILTPSEN